MDVDVEGVAGHFDDGVEVELQVVRDALFDAEVVRLGAFEPGAELCQGKERAHGEDEDGPLAAAPGWGRVGCFGFGCGGFVSFLCFCFIFLCLYFSL